ncbi:hypothetical protein EYC84_007769 [Monilinia fructicola]|uniref:Uncharacterized protein n=1 Tax=Monilinia fructicola TaxID=38448 RepID=A0A5M9JJF0_MONFR|nr:hypothetical protein EYC84_007769 [Monilinia fructicola]
MSLHTYRTPLPRPPSETCETPLACIVSAIHSFIHSFIHSILRPSWHSSIHPGSKHFISPFHLRQISKVPESSIIIWLLADSLPLFLFLLLSLVNLSFFYCIGLDLI